MMESVTRTASLKGALVEIELERRLLELGYLSRCFELSVSARTGRRNTAPGGGVQAGRR
jgi:hypothetical protein